MARIPLPQITQTKIQRQEISDFQGMNNSLHPTLLKKNVPSVLYNSYHRNGILEKRGGTALFGNYLTSKHSESFDATTYKDATNTTGEWTTDGAANLLTNTTTAIDTSTNVYATLYQKDRHSCVSTTETIKYIFISYQDGTGIKARKSADNGATWTNLAGSAGETTITTDTNAFWSLVIDSSDNIHVTYQSDDTDSKIHYKLLTYASGSWTVGTERTVSTPTTNNDEMYPSVCVTSAGTIWVAYQNNSLPTGGHTFSRVRSSTDGITWSAATTLRDSGNNILYTFFPALILQNDKPMCMIQEKYSYNNNTLFYLYRYSTSWSDVTGLNAGNISADAQFSFMNISATSSLLIYKSSVGIRVSRLNSLDQFDSSITISSNINDILGQITTDGTNIWAIWSKYEAVRQYEIVYKLYNGTSWDTTETAITSDNANNAYIQVPALISTWCPLFWKTGTASPYSIKGRVSQLSGVIQSTGYNSSAGSQTYTATVSSTAGTGGTITTTYADCTTLAGTYSAFTADISTLNKQYIKFKSTLTTTNIASAPSIASVEITYGGAKVVSNHSFTRNDGTNYMLAVSGTEIFLCYSDGTKQSIKSGLTANLPCTDAVFQNALVLSNGTNAVMRFNGKVTTGTVTTTNGDKTITGSGTQKWKTASNTDELAAGGKLKLADGNWYTIDSITSDTALELTANYAGTGGAGEAYEAYAISSLAGSPPTGKYICTHNNYLFITGNSTNPTRIYFSDAGDFTTYPAAYFIDANANDGQINTGLASLRNVLGIFKYDAKGTTKSVSGLYGDSSVDFVLRNITTAFGSVGQYSIVPTPNRIYFIDRFRVIETDLVNFTVVDGPIHDITDNWNQQYIQNATGKLFDNHVLFAIPYSTSTTNNYILDYDLQEKGWAIHTGLNPGCFTIYTPSNTPVLYYGDQTTNSAIFQWNSGTSDNGQPINWQYDTGELADGDYFMKKHFKYLYVFFDPTGAYDVTVYYSLDGNSTWVELPTPVETDSGTDDVFKRWNLSVKGSTIKFRFVNNATGSTIKMVKFSYSYRPIGLRRN